MRLGFVVLAREMDIAVLLESLSEFVDLLRRSHSFT